MIKLRLKNLLPLVDCYYEVKDVDNKFIFSSEHKLDGFDDHIITSIKTDDGYNGPVMLIYIWRV